ncbi:MAG: HAMP domain-containing sensor histidine kinase [Bacteroidota bacterium]
MTKRNLFIAVFVVSVFGLAFVQYRYLQIGLNLAKVQFDEKVEKAIVDIKIGLSDQNQLTYLVASAMKKDTSFFKTSPDSIIDASSYFLNDYLLENLTKNGIEADFTYALSTRDSTYYLNSFVGFKDNENAVSYPLLLEGYLPELFEQRFILDLRFNNLNSYFLSQLNGLTFPSLLFMIGIVVVVLWALRTYYWQKSVITTTDEFINNLTHELKTPVFAIHMASKMLEDKVFDKDKTFLTIIRQQAKRLGEHIDKVLELATLERKKTVLHLQRVDFYPHLLKVCKEFETLVDLEKIHFTYDLEPSMYPVLAEAFHLENVVNNLLDNAKKYGDDHSITIRSKLLEDKLVIVIQDTGEGIPKEEQDKIFRKYYRAMNTATNRVKGFGLGLNYVRTIVKKHGGSITLDSTPGKGTTVRLQIPLVKDGKK